MSKSFEKEYKELAQSKLPDLWDRIEAGLSEKKPVSVPITINEEAINNETTIKKADSNKVLVFFRRYQTVAAALLCVIILVPAFLLMRQVGGGIGFSNSEEAKDAAPAEMMYAAAEEAPAAEAPAEEAVAEKAMSDSEQVERSEAKKSADVMLYRVTVEVIEKQEDSSPDISDGTLYLCAVIHNDESNGLEIGDEITVLVPQHLTEELLPGESYEIALTESDSRYYEYVVKSLNY